MSNMSRRDEDTGRWITTPEDQLLCEQHAGSCTAEDRRNQEGETERGKVREMSGARFRCVQVRVKKIICRY